MPDRFELLKYGIKQYTLSQIIYDNNVVAMHYENYIDHISLEGSNFRLVVREDEFVKKICKKINYNTTLKDLMNEFTSPIIRGYYDATMKDIYTYSVEFPVAGKNMVLEFDKNTVTVYTPHNGLVLVYKSDDNNIMISGELLESYHLLDNGFVYTNYNDHISTLYYDGFRDTIKFFFDIRDKMGSQILDYLPERVYHKNNLYKSEFDEFGMTKKCYLDSDKDGNVDYCRYTKEDNVIESIHPFLFDPFAALYGPNLLDFWVKDKLEYIDEDRYEFTREVYKIINVYDLMNSINS